ncbi:hypothetical protein LguiB_017768 [Lonicera macranthoides]
MINNKIKQSPHRTQKKKRGRRYATISDSDSGVFMEIEVPFVQFILNRISSLNLSPLISLYEIEKEMLH